MSTTNGGPSADTAPQISVVAQYIKDFSFENPNAPQSLAASQEQPQIGIQINVNAVFFGCKWAGKQMMAQGGGGAIINLSSIGVLTRAPRFSDWYS